MSAPTTWAPLQDCTRQAIQSQNTSNNTVNNNGAGQAFAKAFAPVKQQRATPLTPAQQQLEKEPETPTTAVVQPQTPLNKNVDGNESFGAGTSTASLPRVGGSFSHNPYAAVVIPEDPDAVLYALHERRAERQRADIEARFRHAAARANAAAAAAMPPAAAALAALPPAVRAVLQTVAAAAAAIQQQQQQQQQHMMLQHGQHNTHHRRGGRNNNHNQQQQQQLQLLQQQQAAWHAAQFHTSEACDPAAYGGRYFAGDFAGCDAGQGCDGTPAPLPGPYSSFATYTAAPSVVAEADASADASSAAAVPLDAPLEARTTPTKAEAVAAAAEAVQTTPQRKNKRRQQQLDQPQQQQQQQQPAAYVAAAPATPPSSQFTKVYQNGRPVPRAKGDSPSCAAAAANGSAVGGAGNGSNNSNNKNGAADLPSPAASAPAVSEAAAPVSPAVAAPTFVLVQHRRHACYYTLSDAALLRLAASGDAVGAAVIVDGDRGVDFGVIAAVLGDARPSDAALLAARQPMCTGGNPLPSIQRLATAEERRRYDTELASDDARALAVAAAQARKHLGPRLEVAAVTFQFDRRKLTLWYSAPERVYFVPLLKAMNQTYKCRIWMERVEDESEEGGADTAAAAQPESA